MNKQAYLKMMKHSSLCKKAEPVVPQKKEKPEANPAKLSNPPSVEKNHPVQTSEQSFTGLNPQADYLRSQDDINLQLRNPALYHFSPEQARLYEKLYKPTSDLGNPVKDTLYSLQYGTLPNNPWGLSNRQYEFAKTSPNWKNYERGMTAGYNRGNAFGSVQGYNKGWTQAADASNKQIGKQFYKEGDIWTKILNWFLRLFGSKGMYGYVKDAVQPDNK